MSGTSQLAQEIALLVGAQLSREIDRRLEKLELAFEQRLIGVEGLAELLGCSEGAARQRVRRDAELRRIAIAGGGGKRWRWRRADLLAALQSKAGDQ